MKQNPHFAAYAELLEKAVSLLANADILAETRLHRRELKLERLSSVLKLIAIEVREEHLIPASKIAAGIQVSRSIAWKHPSSAAKFASARKNGQKGGRARSKAKALAARENAKRPRPSSRGVKNPRKNSRRYKQPAGVSELQRIELTQMLES